MKNLLDFCALVTQVISSARTTLEERDILRTRTIWRAMIVSGKRQAFGALDIPGIFWTRAVLSIFILLPFSALAAPPKVVTSIAPVHSLASMIMQGVGEPHLLIRGSASPHSYSLRPSDAQILDDADLVFWIGNSLETTLATPLQNLAANASIITLSRNPALQTLTGEQPDKLSDGPISLSANQYEHDAIDMHIWLDPANAKLMINEIATELAKTDPDNAKTYMENAAAARKAINDLKNEIENMLSPIKEEKFIFLHDAYRYFEQAFAITPAATMTNSPEKLPGARKIREITDMIRQQDIGCIFSEPQFSPRLVETIVKATGVGSGEMDPLGATIVPGPMLYPDLLRTMATAMRDCLEN